MAAVDIECLRCGRRIDPHAEGRDISLECAGCRGQPPAPRARTYGEGAPMPGVFSLSPAIEAGKLMVVLKLRSRCFLRYYWKRKMRKKTSHAGDELWVAPRYSLKGPQGERAWDARPGGPPHSSRFLELADIALGLKKPAPKKKRKQLEHQMVKKEPYSTESR